MRAFLSGEGLAAPARAKSLAHAFELRREMLANREQYLPSLRCADLGALHTGVLLVSGDRSGPLFHAISSELARCLQNDSTATVRAPVTPCTPTIRRITIKWSFATSRHTERPSVGTADCSRC